MSDRIAQEKAFIQLALHEPGWEVESDGIWIDGRRFPLGHPYSIHLTLYRELEDPVKKLHSMHRVHDLLWPDHAATWNSWQERIFLAHCQGHDQIVLAAGASAGKSSCCAKIAIIFWLSDPVNNAVIVASTTLEALENRIWGYVSMYADSMALPVPIKMLIGKPPKIVHPSQKDKIHGIFATAIREGQDDKVLNSLIGRHPNKRIMIFLDESTDMNPAVTKAFPNLEKGVIFHQFWAIGNSKSKNDLHGAMATPAAGWQSIDPTRDKIWPTTYKNGVCLYFYPWDSPAITETDARKREVLGKFLITAAGIDDAKRQYGEGSDSFNRFCLGFWGSSTMENTLVSEEFAAVSLLYKGAEWSGHRELRICAGLDPAFQVGGTGCVLRLGVLGQQVDGSVVLDFRGDELLFKIDLVANEEKAGELQLAEQVVAILRRYQCPVAHMAMDATGVGRALGELIRIISGEAQGPHRIVSRRPQLDIKGRARATIEPTVTVIGASDMWMKAREFIEHRQLRGLDHTTIAQLTSRLVLMQSGKLVIEEKRAYKSRMAAINPRLAHSPDEADAAILCLQAAILCFGFNPGQKMALPVREAGSSVFFDQKQRAMKQELAKQEAERIQVRPRLVPNFEADMSNMALYKGKYVN